MTLAIEDGSVRGWVAHELESEFERGRVSTWFCIAVLYLLGVSTHTHQRQRNETRIC